MGQRTWTRLSGPADPGTQTADQRADPEISRAPSVATPWTILFPVIHVREGVVIAPPLWRPTNRVALVRRAGLESAVRPHAAACGECGVRALFEKVRPHEKKCGECGEIPSSFSALQEKNRHDHSVLKAPPLGQYGLAGAVKAQSMLGPIHE